MINYTYHGREDRVTSEHLKNGETCKVTGVGNSMLPILKSRQSVICAPVTDETEHNKKDIVLCTVNGRYYLHLIHAVRGDQYLIGNNHGHMNGWVARKSIFGKVVEIL